jgi:UPF0716 protein FxsA
MAAFSIFRLIPLLILAMFCVELASIILMGQALGVFTTVLLVIADVLLGATIIRTAGANALAQVRKPFRAPGFEARLASGMALRVLAGILFLMPGFFSDVLALLFLAPPVQAWIARRFKPVVSGAETARNDASREWRARSTHVIEGEAIEIYGDIEPPAAPDPPREDRS